VGSSEGKRPIGRPRRRWVDNIRMDLGEMGWGNVDWMGLAQDRKRWRALVNSVLNLRVPWNAGNYPVAKHLVASRLVLSSIELVSQLVSYMKYNYYFHKLFCFRAWITGESVWTIGPVKQQAVSVLNSDTLRWDSRILWG
jgi:hypothetical protein